MRSIIMLGLANIAFIVILAFFVVTNLWVVHGSMVGMVFGIIVLMVLGFWMIRGSNQMAFIILSFMMLGVSIFSDVEFLGRSNLGNHYNVLVETETGELVYEGIDLKGLEYEVGRLGWVDVDGNRHEKHFREDLIVTINELK